MLFRPVYGPELEMIYSLIAYSKSRLLRKEIHEACLPEVTEGIKVSPQGIDDGLIFLVSAGLIVDDGGFQLKETDVTNISFRLRLLNQMHRLANGQLSASHELDKVYWQLLDTLFVGPDRLFIADMHTAANSVRAVVEQGGVSQEKIRSWQRVMTFLGAGRRIAGGFQCTYDLTLVQEMVEAWPVAEGFIQDFLESHVAHYLPFQTQTGELPQALSFPLRQLNQQQNVSMRAYQDASTKLYFDQHRWRYMVRQEAVR